jgi:5-formyltetrahydrofolate cyclo-ligase
MESIEAAKAAARKAALARRRGLEPSVAGLALASHVLRGFQWPIDTVIAGFWPMGQEIDVRPLLTLLHDKGHRIALPATPPKGNPLEFRLWAPGAMMVPERFGTMRPTGDLVVPDVLLMPLLLFDAMGNRLGYGGGYYDRTLAGLPGRFRLGCAFAAQQVDAVPVALYDVPLDAVATETGIIRCGEANAHSVSG